MVNKKLSATGKKKIASQDHLITAVYFEKAEDH